MPNKPILPKRVLEQHTLSRYERERRTRKFVVVGSIVVGIVVLLLIAAAALQILVFEPNRAVASVNGQDITVTQLQSRMRLEWEEIQYNYTQLAQQVQQLQQSKNENDAFLVQFYQQQLQQVVARASVDQVARTALDALIDEQLIRQEAQRRGITVSPEEVQKEIETSLGYYRATLTPFPTYTPVTPEPTMTPAPTAAAPTAAATASVTTTGSLLPSSGLTTTAPLTASALLTPTPTTGPLPTATPRLQPTSITQADLQQKRENGVKFYTGLGYPAQQFEHTYETSLLTKKLQDAIATEVPTKTQHYKFDYVRFNNVTTATQYAQLLASGKITFEAVITQANTITQPEPLGMGANRDWTSQSNVDSQYGIEVLAMLDSAPLNKPTGVITSQATGGYYVLLPLGREVRPLDEADLTQAQSKAYNDWLTKARADTAHVQRKIEPVSIMPRDMRSEIEQFQTNVGSAGVPQ
jgi:hypothetical protein